MCACMCVCVHVNCVCAFEILSLLPMEPQKLPESPCPQLFLDATLYMHTLFHPGLRSLSGSGPEPRVVSSPAVSDAAFLNRSAREASDTAIAVTSRLISCTRGIWRVLCPLLFIRFELCGSFRHAATPRWAHIRTQKVATSRTSNARLGLSGLRLHRNITTNFKKWTILV